MLFEYAVLKNVYDEDGTYKCDMLLVPVTAIAAQNEEVAKAAAARAIPDNIDLNRVTILVRPFV